MKPENRLSKILMKMKSADFIYSAVIFILIGLVVILFSYSTSFIVKNVDKIFSFEQETSASALDMTTYSIVVKKLGLPENTTQESPAVPAEVPPENTVTPPEEAPAVETPVPAVVLDKQSITINILNSTSKKGVAATLAGKMETAGFAKAETGNEKKSYALTTIIIKEEKKEYLSVVEEAVKASYPKAVTETAAGKTDFDVTIIIGKQ
jgi:hypothetical protein